MSKVKTVAEQIVIYLQNPYQTISKRQLTERIFLGNGFWTSLNWKIPQFQQVYDNIL
jgi:hypothetical protein